MSVHAPKLRKPLVSIIVPAKNEEKNIRAVLRGISSLPFRKEILVVDDGSSDLTANLARAFRGVKILRLPESLGRAGALLRGFQRARGAILVTHDGDGEYPPSAVLKVVREVQKTGGAVFGNRLAKGRPPAMLRLYYAGNLFLSAWFSLLLKCPVQDLETGCKAFPRRYLRAILTHPLMAEGPCGCPQLGASILSQGGGLTEVAIDYRARPAREKKIRWPSGLTQAFICLRLAVRG